jgi:hypothetical protein
VVEDDEFVGQMLVRKMFLEDRDVFDPRVSNLGRNIL